MRIVSRQPSEAAPARMAPLAVLPVFMDLKGKHAVVAGGSDAAAWKSELLAAAGAEVHLYAPASELPETLVNVMAGAQGRIVRRDEAWSERALAGAAIAIIDAGDEEEAASFALAARRAGVPCNVIDRPEFCTFQFGSIVNRSPVVIGISSSGAAPILAQAIRRRIETLLPHALADWAAMAQRLRASVMQRLKPGGERRIFWEIFVERAFGPPPGEHEALQFEHAAAGLAGVSSVSHGHFTLIGAGPGDADLLTLKAVRALQAADVIFFEEGVSGDVLELARREAKRILLRGGSEAEAAQRMAHLVAAGKRVVHLEPGDASSAQAILSRFPDQGISAEVIPGVAATDIRLVPSAGDAWQSHPEARPPRRRQAGSDR